jgi:hypothetical protein
MIDELNPTPAKPKESHKIGDNPKNKVRILRPFLIDDTRVDKGDVAFVTDAHLKSHGHIFEKLALIAFLLSALCFSSLAQSYSANQVTPWTTTNSGGTNYWLNGTNICLVPYASNQWYLATNPATGNIAGGAMATNTVPGGTTNSQVLVTPVGLTRYDQVAVELTGLVITNSSGTGWLFLYPCDDGVNIDTNHPIASLSFTGGYAGGTNILLCTNIANTLLGSHGYIGAGIGNAGTNSFGSLFLQFFVKPQRSG